MKALEMETAIQVDGKLPVYFREAFGRKARVIVLLDDGQEKSETRSQKKRIGLSELAGKIHSFSDVNDPVAYQKSIRSEWTRGEDDGN